MSGARLSDDKLHISASAGFPEFCKGSIGSDCSKTRKTENCHRRIWYKECVKVVGGCQVAELD